MTVATGFQRSVALASLASRGSPVFVEQFVLEVPSAHDADDLRRAWTAVLERHPGLSAQYGFVGVHLTYRQLPPWDGHLSFTTRRATSVADAERLCAADYRPFELGADEPLWRATVIEFDSARWFCITLHHLVFDDRSWRIIRSDLAAALHHPTATPTPERGFADFLTWRATPHGRGDESARSRARALWADLTSQLEGPTVLPSLAPSNEHHRERHGENLRFPVSLDDEFDAHLRTMMSERRATGGHLALAAWAIVLSRLCRTDTVCFGQTRHGVPADLAEAVSIVGPMVDTLPFVVPVADSMPVDDFLADIASRHRQRYDLGPLEGPELVALAFPPGTDTPLSTVVNHVRVASVRDATVHDDELPVVRQRKSAALQPTLTVVEGEQFRFEVVTSAHHAEFGRLAARALGVVLRQLVDRPRVVGDVSTTDASDRAATELCGPPATPAAATLADLLSDSLCAHGDRTALDGAARLTYADLDRASLALAHRIGMADRTEPGCVAVVAVPGALAVVAFVATVRSGHCVVCVDPTRPAAEVNAVLRLVDPDVVVTEPGGLDPSVHGRWRTELLDAGLLDGTGPGAAHTPGTVRQAQPHDLAYLVATSGSTGVPKVVEIEQASAANAIGSLIEAYGMRQGDRRLRSVSRPGADVYLAELLVPLCCGATLVEALGERPLTPAQLFDLLDRESITVAGAASSYLAELVDARVGRAPRPAPRTLRMMTTGTEVVDPSIVGRWREAMGDGVALLNVYGPAEATLVTTTCRLSDLAVPVTGPVPVGVPLPGTRVMLLDRAGHPVPRGAVGEICVAGAGVMRGYRGIDTTTVVAADPSRSTERHYRTGDLGRIGVDGQLVFVGRGDRQVKIRGHRVELEGVEARLRRVTDMPTVAVAAVERSGRMVLLAAVETNGPIDEVAIRSRMAAEGSPAEVPAGVVGVSRLPRLANGKLDRRAIAALLVGAVPGAVEPESDVRPHDSTTIDVPAMVSLWNELFERDDCDAASDFFDLGGDSLLAVRLAVEVELRFGVAMDLDALYALRRLESLVSALAPRRGSGTRQVIQPLAVTGRGAPVYFMHHGYGISAGWESITTGLADEFDCWVITGRFARGLAAPSSVVDACAEYVEALAAHSAGRPVTIIGFSACGVLAYETARAARAAGLPVRAVVLLETSPPNPGVVVRVVARASLIHWLVPVAEFRRAVVRRLGRAARRVRRVVPRSAPAGAAAPGVPYFELVAGHRPGPADFHVTVVETRAPFLLNLRVAWTIVARRRVARTVFDTRTHVSLLQPPFAPVLAEILRKLPDGSRS